MTEQRKAVILAYADCNMNMKETARYMGYSCGAIQHHLRQIKGKTGLDPHVFYDLVELLDMIREDEDCADNQ